VYYTVLDSDLDKICTGSYTEVHTWLESQPYGAVYHIYNHQAKEWMTGHEFWTSRD
jgi:hypothetical protein